MVFMSNFQIIRIIKHEFYLYPIICWMLFITSMHRKIKMLNSNHFFLLNVSIDEGSNNKDT